MKKKNDKIVILKDSDLSSVKVNILEANESQQVIILFFSSINNLSNYNLAIFKTSPLLGSPEKISKFIYLSVDLPLTSDKKVYIIFNKNEHSVTTNEEGDILVYYLMKKPFKLEADEVIALLEKSNDDNQLKIIDWVKPIKDEPIPIESLQMLRERYKKDQEISGSKYYSKPVTNEQNNALKSSLFEKPFFWITLVTTLISILSFITSFSSSDTLTFSALKFLLLLIQNFYISILCSKWIRSRKKFSLNFLFLFFFFIILLVLTSYFIGLYTPLLSSVLLAILSITYALKIKI